MNYQYRWSSAVDGFSMPLKLITGEWLTPTSQWQAIKLGTGKNFVVDKNFYINFKKV
jgi:hypothetical protein